MIFQHAAGRRPRRALQALLLILFPRCLPPLLVTLIAAAAAEYPRETQADELPKVDFSTQILPILSENCFACHGPDAEHRAADLRLDDEAAAKEFAIVAGQPDESEVVARMLTDDEDLRMPPPKSGKQLSDEQIALVRAWIEQGAPWAQHWAFDAPQRPAVPDVAGSDWPQNEIDHFTLVKMRDAQLSPSESANRAAWLRRVSFDLTGLPPTPDEVRAFEADASAEAYERVVDRLLESPHYGERLAVEWLDLARFADTNGYQNDFNRSMWPWRDWVIRAFNQNMPFDQFIIEQLAGDLLPNPSTEQLIATGFNRNHRMVTEGGSIDEEWRVENVVDRVETTATAFLGLTMGCARCHDHKYDPISRNDFYQFFAFFNNVDEQGVYTETRGNVPPLISVPTEQERQKLAEFDGQITELEGQTASEEQADESLAKQLEELRKQRAEFEKSMQTTMIMRDRAEYRPTYLLKRGQYDAPDTSETLWPEVPEFLGRLPEDAPRNRLALAQWLVDPSNPLVARVTVNRIWQRMFGKGLVTSPDNFGVQGDAPTHPKLLDWLAIELIESGWNLKQMHRQIALSATYQQASEGSAEAMARDPDNRWLARGPRHRLPAELIRDNALAVSGLLVPKIGGPSVKPYQPDGLWDELAGGANGGPYVVAEGDDLYRRSLYTFRKRTVSHPTLGTFDAPSWEICQAKRAKTNTPLQALALLNDLTYVEAARHLALRMMSEAKPELEDRIEYGFTLATLRAPESQELETLRAGYDKYLAFFEEHPEAAQQYLSQGKSQVAPEQRTPELAALSTVAAVILNLDETITK